MTDEDIYAFNAVPPKAAAAAPTRPQRRLWPWLLGGLALIFLLAVAGGVAALMSLLDAGREGWHVTIDGEEWHGAGGPGLLALLGVAGGLFVALLTVVLVVPLTLLLVALGLALGLGGVVLALGLVVAVLLSPFWGLLLLLWLLLRKRPATVSA
ncbi:MAG: hypothetical protein JNM33_07820 [Rubrivivax sp.]|nr:hypothetical protein [Rubrivivax sp.]